MSSEKEKMLKGELYNAADKELRSEREYARALTFEFNATRPHEIERRNQLLQQLIKPKGPITIEPPFYCDYGYNISVGDNFYANFGCVIICPGVSIGNNTTIGAGSVVTRDIPNNVIAVGNPCKIIKTV